ncbi:hypothetical protein KKB83_02540 [Patescibacteria group bacterium]|nr:hypothetical protein [Patescibacteria group bacterium]
MEMNLISTKQLRENFPFIRDKLREGQRFLLIYRSQPLAELNPVGTKVSLKLPKTSNTSRGVRVMRTLAGGLHLGKGLPPKKMNDSYNKEYGKMLP